MTALTGYDRLESAGLWREGRLTARREVLVSIGEATLAIYDHAENALGHWSLPAIERLNPGISPALFAPGFNAEETLEIDDETMIEAIETVRNAVARHRPQKRRLRYNLLAGASVLLLGLGVFWLPDALIRHTASVVPPAARKDIGERLLTQLALTSGTPCRARGAQQSLRNLADRVLGPGGGRLVVMGGAVGQAEHLPGGLIVLDRSLIERQDSPETVAGFILAERERAASDDPLLRLLRMAGPVTAFRMLTTGQIEDKVLRRHVERLAVEIREPVDPERLLARFRSAGLSAAPYARALEEDLGDRKLAAVLRAGDPVDAETAEPIVADRQWVALQGICAG
ncbi:hypothetical protein [Profundibacterium mesophilum]|uniref:Uncharacterized protein n=1 Tax=Profundibacterium mesophilum KAUST100406-0324 TaxID=1037889 RepID=A0A921TDV9_9RHOB|nr:hypothetical protein [Profundibacterium mesophilum]KAF0677233.1 hypothetical protein PMES_00550 [Profundibacterium mesophilum KAUST100406-0324]